MGKFEMDFSSIFKSRAYRLRVTKAALHYQRLSLYLKQMTEQDRSAPSVADPLNSVSTLPL
jgi:hypothetical protein